jgi:hypothetical protein
MGGIGLSIITGLYSGRFNINSLIYYTTLSNLLCFLFYIPLTIRNAINIKNSNEAAIIFFPRLKGAFILMITVTLIIYHSLLANFQLPFFTRGDGDLSNYLQNLLLHYIVPVMVIFDWILFDPKRTFSVFDPLYWLSIPIIYAVFALIRAEVGGMLQVQGHPTRYPYFFLDIDEIGWSGMIVYVIIFALVFALLGYIIWALDRFILGRKNQN